MTLDEAIRRNEEVVERCVKYGVNDGEKKCAEEHRQLAEWLKDYKRLLEQESCEDAISRKEVLDWIKWYGNDAVKQGYNTSILYVWTHIRDNIPSFRPARPRGKWEKISMDKYVQHANYYYKCSECGKDIIGEHNFCPNCGADMRESEDK